MKNQSKFLEPLVLLQIALALFFGLTGLLYLLKYDSFAVKFARFFGRDDTLTLITAIIQLIMGIILLIGLFGIIPQKTMFLAAIVILIIWIIQIIMTHFFGNFLEPKFLPWLQKLSADLIVLAGLWGVATRYTE